MIGRRRAQSPIALRTTEGWHGLEPINLFVGVGSHRFLIIRGQKRTYKIHLGSGNILMEPNDQYLCIVPDSRSRTRRDNLFLTFEGENTLSIIISKALMLAEDTKIKDRTITRQIDSR